MEYVYKKNGSDRLMRKNKLGGHESKKVAHRCFMSTQINNVNLGF